MNDLNVLRAANNNVIVWIITLILMIAGFRYLKDILISIMMKLYELLLQKGL